MDLKGTLCPVVHFSRESLEKKYRHKKTFEKRKERNKDNEGGLIWPLLQPFSGLFRSFSLLLPFSDDRATSIEFLSVFYVVSSCEKV